MSDPDHYRLLSRINYCQGNEYFRRNHIIAYNKITTKRHSDVGNKFLRLKSLFRDSYPEYSSGVLVEPYEIIGENTE
jgi:hypothetical protein